MLPTSPGEAIAQSPLQLQSQGVHSPPQMQPQAVHTPEGVYYVVGYLPDWQMAPQECQYYNPQVNWSDVPNWNIPTGCGLSGQQRRNIPTGCGLSGQQRQDNRRLKTRPRAQQQRRIPVAPTRAAALEEPTEAVSGHAQRSGSLSDAIEKAGGPLSLMHGKELSDWAVDELEGNSSTQRAEILKLVQPFLLDLAKSPCGCRVVQVALEVAGGKDRAAFLEPFVGHSIAMVDCKHGNHVLQKFIEVMPPDTVQFVMDELALYPGGWNALACHKFGCRVEQRLIEHCTEEMTQPLTKVVASQAGILCRDQYGNYVVQHTLEHCSLALRSQVAQALICAGGRGLLTLAQNRMASNVLEKALQQCGQEDQQALAQAVLYTPGALLDMGCSRFGFYVVRRLLEVLQGSLRTETLRQLHEGKVYLRASDFGKGLLSKMGEAEHTEVVH